MSSQNVLFFLHDLSWSNDRCLNHLNPVFDSSMIQRAVLQSLGNFRASSALRGIRQFSTPAKYIMDSKPMVVFVLGPPGAGKGTQSDNIVKASLESLVLLDSWACRNMASSTCLLVTFFVLRGWPFSLPAIGSDCFQEHWIRACWLDQQLHQGRKDCSCQDYMRPHWEGIKPICPVLLLIL